MRRTDHHSALWIVLFSLPLLSSCANDTHLLYSVSRENYESGRQWVWPYFLEDRPAVIAFWNTDVAQCLRDIPALKTLDQRETSVQLVTVVTGLDRLDIEKWLHRERIGFVVLLDLEERFASRLGVYNYPMYLLIGADGNELSRRYSVRSVANWFDRPRWLERSGAKLPEDAREPPAETVAPE